MATRKANLSDLRTAVNEFGAASVTEAEKHLAEALGHLHTHRYASARQSASRARAAVEAVLKYADEVEADLGAPLVAELEQVGDRASRFLLLVENAPEEEEAEGARR
ncbi:MAG: hypothetical protein HYT87_11480 [Nitrospirae bacterium]|nr:hypothetical protein [Nitrospirota bacterium]